MRTNLSWILSLVFLCGAGMGTVIAAKKPRVGMAPVDPAILLKALPREVDGWALKVSTGSREFGEWMESHARRDFEQIIENPKPGKTPPPGFVRVSLKDTAKFKDGDLLLFANFKPLKNVEEGFEYLYYNRHPAIIIRGNQSVEAQFLIGGRFILKIYMKNVPEKFLTNWYKTVNIAKLQSIKDGPLKPLPDQITQITIDELNPKKNSRVSASLGIADIPDDEADADELESGEN